MILFDLLHNTNFEMSLSSPCTKSNDKISPPECTSALPSSELYFHSVQKNVCNWNGKMKGFNLEQQHFPLLQQNTTCFIEVVILQPALTRPLVSVACPILHSKLQVVSNMYWEPKDKRIRAVVTVAQWLLLCSI